MSDSKLLGLLDWRSSAIPNREQLALWARYRRRAAINVIDNFFVQLATLSRFQPYAQAHRHNLELIRDVPYLSSGSREHLLDIYRPVAKPGPWPIVLYVHGGGFRILSKESHWLMAISFARRGYLVFNINYRLGPRGAFPGAIQDVCAAFRWVVRNAGAFGGDLSRLVLAGESAGGNLVTALTVASSYERSEAWARQVFDTGVQPAAVVPACGMLQVSDIERYQREGSVSPWIFDYMAVVSEAYLPKDRDPSVSLALADPLVTLERGELPVRPLPPFFIPVGGADPLLADSRRLEVALQRLGVDVESKVYDGEGHAFHAFIWKRAARLCWSHTFDFLAHRLARSTAQRRAAERERPVLSKVDLGR